VLPPTLWGNENTVRERLRDGISDLKLTRRVKRMAFPFNETEVVEFFRTYFGPVKRTFEKLDQTGQENLRRDLEEAWKENNKATDGTTEIDAEYLEVIAHVA
jgi:hypothetical protein